MEISMNVNGDDVTREVEPRTLLVHFIRDHLGLTGTHWGCDTSNCGTCVVWVDNEPVKSCTTLAAMTGGHEVRTVEGMEVDGVLTARALLDRNPDPTDAEIREAISGQICRCTGYSTIVRSIQWAAAKEQETPVEVSAS